MGGGEVNVPMRQVRDACVGVAPMAAAWTHVSTAQVPAGPQTHLQLQGGEVTYPGQGRMFYLSQKPYLVAGSLRDQLLYPQPPRAVWATTGKATRERWGFMLLKVCGASFGMVAKPCPAASSGLLPDQLLYPPQCGHQLAGHLVGLPTVVHCYLLLS